jgi:hypothetical protein
MGVVLYLGMYKTGRLRTERAGTTDRATMESKFNSSISKCHSFPPSSIPARSAQLAHDSGQPLTAPNLNEINCCFCKSFIQVCISISEPADPRRHRFKKTQVKQISLLSLTSTLYVNLFRQQFIHRIRKSKVSETTLCSFPLQIAFLILRKTGTA